MSSVFAKAGFALLELSGLWQHTRKTGRGLARARLWNNREMLHEFTGKVVKMQ